MLVSLFLFKIEKIKNLPGGGGRVERMHWRKGNVGNGRDGKADCCVVVLSGWG